MVCEHTLKVRKFPVSLTDGEKEDFLRHLGAKEVKVITSKLKQTSVAYAKFETKQMARTVIQRIHQLKILDSHLCVEYAEKDIGESNVPIKKELDESRFNKNYKSFIKKLNGFNTSLGFNQPPPNHLKYSYPKVNRATINNIAHALASIPKFYVQVLHLMNRMNLPPPFSEDSDEIVVGLPELVCQAMEAKKESSDESEIESDPEENKTKEIIPLKRNLPQKKSVKRPKFIKPTIQMQQTAQTKEIDQEVFDKVSLQQLKKIEVKVNSDCLENKTHVTILEDIAITNPQENNEKETNEPMESQDVLPNKDVISEEELLANRIPVKDLQVLSIFKDYHPGIPSCRLYIKNIAKQVEKSDLEFIYKRFKSKEDSAFDIRLMQEGRMKGQAFVTMENVEAAQKALGETNGFILKDKPLVVVFGKAGTTKK